MKLSLQRIVVIILVGLSSPSLIQADYNYVLNGQFTSNNGNAQLGYAVSATNSTIAVATHWTSSGYNLLFIPSVSAADSTASNGGTYVGQYGHYDTLWGSNNGGTGTLMADPSGGNFIASDGNADQGPLQQVITGLTKGQSYAVSFYWAGAQQYGYTGANNGLQWGVSLGGQTKSTTAINDASQNVTPWTYTTLIFQADGPTDTLSFLANAGSGSAPPFLLLGDVSMSAVPEPSSMVLVSLGTLGFVGYGLRRRARSKVA
jgi:hypothetical protein